MSTDDLTTRKSELRERVRLARAALPSGFRAFGSQAACERLIALLDELEPSVVFAYGATSEEIDPAVVVEHLLRSGTVVALPRIEDPGELSAREFGAWEELERGPFGLSQPGLEALRVAPARLDAVIVPGIAFDLAGARLGFGGGYYDRFLPRTRKDCLRVALAFDEQVVESLPIEPHDARVDAIVTPTRVIRIER